MKKNASRMLKATHDGEGVFAGHPLSCALLSDGTRVVALSGIADALSHADRFPALLGKLRPHLVPRLHSALACPLRYRDTKGVVHAGADVRHLFDLVLAVSKASQAGDLDATIAKTAKAILFEIVMAGFKHKCSQALGAGQAAVTWN